ncbi:large ribosomal subunit protein uL16c-like [Bidens hawaiensis]|uniref:large ribosomal subunit protein uL16c-like n=1 Tax=Bidens hawaiensis TaxID=980011 RepID=UPI004049A836
MKFPKYRKGRIEGVRDGGNEICFGKYALQALEPARISAKQIEAGRRALQMNVRRGGKGGKVWVRVFPYKSVTSKPAETRMGRGKGAISYWVAPVKAGQILYEMGGVTESLAKKAIEIAGSKMPILTRSIIRDPQVKEIGVR